MIILDFIFHFFVRWFQVSDRRKVKKVTYTDQASYAITICLLVWLILLNAIIEYFLFNTFKSKIPSFAFIILGVLIYFIFRYVYIINNRYSKIMQLNDPKFGISDKSGRIVVLILFFSSFIVFYLTAIVLHNL